MLATTIILVVAIVAFCTNRLPPALVALCVVIALYLTGSVDLQGALSGFADPVFVYLAGLFVVAEALELTGLTAWAGQQLTRTVGDRRSWVLVALMLLSAALTALVSTNAAVATLVPVGVMLATRTGQSPSQLLIPITFAAQAGAMLTLLGRPVNLIASEMAADAGAGKFGFFEFALVGVPLVVGVVLIVALLGPRLLPERTPASTPKDLGAHAETLAHAHSLAPGETALSYEEGATEIVIPPRSPFLGDEVHPGMLTESGELIVVAIQRGGRNLAHAKLEAGDVLVLRGAWEALERQSAHAGVIPVDAPDQVRRQSVVLGPRSWIAAGVLVAMCTALALDLAPAAIVVLCAAAVLGLTRVVSPAQAQRSISLSTLMVVAGMVPLSVAIRENGIADFVSAFLVDGIGSSSPHLLLAAVVGIVLLLGQVVSNLATFLVVAPVAVSVAQYADVSPLPLLMGMLVAGAASFLTPVATPSNLMVQEPGAYRFGDYWRLGLPCLLLFSLTAVFLVPLLWPF